MVSSRAFAVAAIDIERAFDLSGAWLGFLLAAGIVTGTAVAAVGQSNQG